MVTPALLHAKAHAAALEASRNGWLHGSLETGLAAAAGAAHPPGSRELGARALQAIIEWSRRGDARAIGEDAAALCLAAWAAQRLQAGEPELKREAVSVTARTAGARRSIVAPLHLALCAWGLRGTVGVSDAEPWPELRERMRGAKAAGLDRPLLALAGALCSRKPNARALAGELAAIPSVTLGEACVLLWVLWTGTELLGELLADNDPELETVRRRRSEVFDRVAAEVGERPFAPVEYEDFDPFAEDEPDLGEHPTLDHFDALMLDLALSGEMTGEPVRTPREFARAVAAARAPLAGAIIAMALACSVVACGAGAAIAALAQGRVPFDVGVGGALLGIGVWVTLVPVIRRLGGKSAPAPYVDMAVALALCSLAVLVDSAVAHPPVGLSNLDGLLAAVLAPLVVLAVSALSRRGRA